jgi:outer membrane protein assembly factor BamE
MRRTLARLPAACRSELRCSDARPSPLRRRARVFAIATAAVLLAGCQSPQRGSGLLEPYRVAVPQGNYVDQSMMGLVKPGMTPEQVRFALGSPLLVSAFHPDRWDYVFRYQFPDGSAINRRAAVHFRDGRVERIEAEALPAREDPADPALPGYRPPRRSGRPA